MRRSRPLAGVTSLVLAAGLGCADGGARALEQRRVALGREVAGLKKLAAGLERGPFVASDDVIVAIDDTLVRDLIAAQLPFETDVERFHVRLTGTEVRFYGSPVVQLRGEARLRERPAIAGTLSILGAIEDITIDGRSGILRARIAVDELAIDKAAGLEAWLSAGTLDDLAITLRSGLVALLPPIEIPVSVRQRLELPAVTTGPVLIQASVMPLRAAVTRVVAGRGKLWIGVRVQPGDVVRPVDAPARAGASGVGDPEPEASGP
jgi:hypothetical protein